MSQELIQGAVLVLFSLALEVVPGLRGLWARVSPDNRQTYLFGIYLGLPLLALGAAALSVDVGLGIALPVADASFVAQYIFDLEVVAVAAYMFSQATYPVVSRLGEALTPSRN